MSGRLFLVLCGIAAAAGAYAARDQLRPLADMMVSAKPAPDGTPERSATKKSDGTKQQGRSGPPAPPVTAAIAVEADMPVILAAPGTVEPLANVAIKPRVDGQIVEVGFQEGDLVERGQVLFRLDDRMVKAQIAQAEANIAKDQASLRDAEATLPRREALIDKQVVTEAALDQARYAVEGLKASIAAGRALLEMQKTQLDYLTIRAPDHRPHRQPRRQARRHGARRRTPRRWSPSIRRGRSWSASPCRRGELGALRRALAAKATAEVTVPGSRAGQVVHGDASPSSTTRSTGQTGTIAVKVHGRERRRGAVAGPVRGGGAHRRGQAEACCRCRRAAVLPAQQGMITWVIGADNKVTPRVGDGGAHRRPDGVPAARASGRRARGDRRPDAPGARVHRSPSRSRAARRAADASSERAARERADG